MPASVRLGDCRPHGIVPPRYPTRSSARVSLDWDKWSVAEGHEMVPSTIQDNFRVQALTRPCFCRKVEWKMANRRLEHGDHLNWFRNTRYWHMSVRSVGIYRVIHPGHFSKDLFADAWGCWHAATDGCIARRIVSTGY